MILLKVSGLIDRVNGRIGVAVGWLVLAAAVIGAGNATYRYIFHDSSNGWLEIQWYLFSATFLFCAPYTLMRNEHVRIDVISSRFSARTRAGIDIFGTIFFLFPMAFLILYMSIPMVEDSYLRHEVSSNAGGLIRWPVKILIPIGFILLILQGVSELIKRVAFLKGLIPDPAEKKQQH